jgi:hypothetical protein
MIRTFNAKNRKDIHVCDIVLMCNTAVEKALNRKMPLQDSGTVQKADADANSECED